MNDVVMKQENQGLAEHKEGQVVDQSNSVMQAIVAAASNPEIDPEKMERMMALYERMEYKKAEMAYNAAFAAMQGDLPMINESGKIIHNGKLISEYAKWDEDINPAIKPILQRHGFALSFRVDTKDGVNVEVVLAHAQGHSERTSIHLPVDTGGAKNAVQAVASSVSYGKRYAAGALLNLNTGGMDDDGQGAGGYSYVTAEQAADLGALADEVGADKKKFLAYWQVKDFSEFSTKQLDNAIKSLEAKRK